MSRKADQPPKGGRQDLRAPMPEDTRYVGEGCTAGDPIGRYLEHLAKIGRDGCAALDAQRTKLPPPPPKPKPPKRAKFDPARAAAQYRKWREQR